MLWQDTNVSNVHAASIFTSSRRHYPEDLYFNLHRRENFKSGTHYLSLSFGHNDDSIAPRII
jgi:hypothetical protein